MDTRTDPSAAAKAWLAELAADMDREFPDGWSIEARPEYVKHNVFADDATRVVVCIAIREGTGE